VAVAHSIFGASVYHLLIDEHPFEDRRGVFDQRQRQHLSRHLKLRLERLGYRVQLEPSRPPPDGGQAFSDQDFEIAGVKCDS